jgi:hydroxypyruvate reductase
MLSMAIHLKGANGITALSIDTDGIDGVEDNAGAFISDQTLKKAKSKNLQPQKFLDNNDSYSFFETIDDLIFTKPTLTNVNDFRAVLIQP